MQAKRFLNYISTSNTFIAVVVCIVGLAATLATWQEANQTLTVKTNTTLTQAINDTNDAFEKRIAIYEEVLRGTSGLFVGTNTIVSRESFANYVDNLTIRERLPGLQGIGFSQEVRPDEVASFEAAMQAEGLRGFTINPAGQRDIYTAIRYIEPFDERNQRAIGFDMFSEPVRRTSMEAARDTGTPTITGIVTLRQETETDRQSGFLFYMPVYFGPSETIEQRRANIVGYVYAPVRLGDLMDGIYELNDGSAINIKLYDSTDTSPEHIIYQNNLPAGDLTVSQPIKHGNHTWTVVASGSAGVLDSQERQQPFMIIILGGAASILFASFIYIVMRGRARELAYQKQLNVQRAKDELLSLASHQLRTPATGVKQYLGIVLEGYTGKITDEQRSMLRKAYTSNERQLEIVNQLLHVTRLETGRLSMRFAPVNLDSLIQDVIQEQHDTIKSRNQILQFKHPKTDVTIDGDAQYLRMAIENLLSNASKYTHNDGSITVSLVAAPDRATISIADTGVGIDPMDYSKLFQKFSRIDNELSIQAGGSGIGLYLTKEIIELHGGSISVDSDRDTGSTFTVVIPKLSNSTSSAAKV